MIYVGLVKHYKPYSASLAFKFHGGLLAIMRDTAVSIPNRHVPYISY